MGFMPSGDGFCRVTDNALEGLQDEINMVKIVDDILLQGETEEEVMEKLEIVLKRCREWGITLSKKKMKIAQSVKFAGFVVTSEEICPDPEKLSAFADFKATTDVTSLKSFLGLMNQLGSYHPDLSQSTVNMRELLKKQVAWN